MVQLRSARLIGEMPISYTVVHRSMHINAVASGVISRDDIVRYVEERVRDGIPDYGQVIDLRSATFGVPPSEIVDALQSARRRLGVGPVVATAVLMETRSEMEPTAREFVAQLAATGVTVKLFRTFAASTSWIQKVRTSSSARGVRRTRDGASDS
jgi:hypothetical protein